MCSCAADLKLSSDHTASSHDICAIFATAMFFVCLPHFSLLNESGGEVQMSKNLMKKTPNMSSYE
ncbi:uncharacterized protein LOC128862146 isoform X2 [Anastrepha ludens]|uniref:uncharacterized protein LOC128862146 isoform X2 n=1 Tax=Anastrepha ludens TaxID=28586 RepID=UPI0023B075EC|nr:uncharacterized protein LOC128862146 isoform X2 [Anastrepha ludens]